MTENQSHKENVLKPISSNILLQPDMSIQEKIKQPDYEKDQSKLAAKTKGTFLDSRSPNLSKILRKTSRTIDKSKQDTQKGSSEEVEIICIRSGDSKGKRFHSNFMSSRVKKGRTNDSNPTHSSGDGSDYSDVTIRHTPFSFEDDEGFEDDCTGEETACDHEATTRKCLLPSDIFHGLGDSSQIKEDDLSDGGSEILELLHKSLTNFNEEVLAEHASQPEATGTTADMKALPSMNEKSLSTGSRHYKRNKGKVNDQATRQKHPISSSNHAAQAIQQTLNLRKSERLDSGTFCETYKICDNVEAKSKSFAVAKRSTFSANSSPKHQSFFSTLSDSSLDRSILERPLSLYSMTVSPQISFSQHFTYNEPQSGYTTRPILKLRSSSPPVDLAQTNKFLPREKRHFEFKDNPSMSEDSTKHSPSKTFEFQINASQKRTRYKTPKEVHSLPPLLQIAAKSREIESHLESSYVSVDNSKLPHGSNLPYPEKCKRACSFYLRGHCKKEDCEFAHDLTKVTCKFWQMGECFKGTTCPFLHGYLPENVI